MRTRFFITAMLLAVGLMAMGGPVKITLSEQVKEPTLRLSPERFRCILVGDSQTTTPDADRVRTQMHRWDAPIVGELITSGNSSAGILVNNSNAGISGVLYQTVNLNTGWADGGPDDFFAEGAARWLCAGDIEASGSRVGRYRVRFGAGNFQAPWDSAWGIGVPLVAKIAVRTSPMSVDAIQTRADRGGVVSSTARTTHTLSKEWGVQIIEQPIPADFNPTGDDVGVGLYFPVGSTEMPGQKLEILGVLIERVDQFGSPMNGTVIGYQGRGGWSMQDHLEKISFASRAALIEMINPDYIMVMLGHNREPGGEDEISPNLNSLVWLWELPLLVAGEQRPSFLFVTPWASFFESASPYLIVVEDSMQAYAEWNPKDFALSYLPMFEYARPDIADPKNYLLDGENVHPGDIPTAWNLSEDLYDLLFRPNE